MNVMFGKFALNHSPCILSTKEFLLLLVCILQPNIAVFPNSPVSADACLLIIDRQAVFPMGVVEVLSNRQHESRI